MIPASETATNALVHGRAPRCVWVYERDTALVCHVYDGGQGPDDPLVGYPALAIDTTGGSSLRIAHQFCDIVEIATVPSGTHSTCA